MTSVGRCAMGKLTADDILDLGRWHFIQFADAETASAAMERYRRYVERQRDIAAREAGTEAGLELADDQDELAA